MAPPRVVPRPKPRAQRRPANNDDEGGSNSNAAAAAESNTGSQQQPISETTTASSGPSAPVRLEGLSGRAGTPSIGGAGSPASSSRASSVGPRPVFRPKMIARRNKEERESAAKQAEEEATIAAAIVQPKQPSGPSTRGGRGGRGGFGSRRGGKQEPKITFASGPFAMPSFGSNRKVGRAREKQSIDDISAMTGARLSSKKKENGEEDSDAELSMEAGARRIDVSGKPIKSEDVSDSDDEDDEESQFFPIRVTRVAHRDPTATGVSTLPSSVSTLPVDGEGITIKSEQDDETTIKIKNEPQEENYLSSSILSQERQPSIKPNYRPLVPEYSPEERKRLQQDYQTLTREFSLKAHLGGGGGANKGKEDATKGKLMIFQTSSIFPQFKAPSRPIKKEKIKKETTDEDTMDTTATESSNKEGKKPVVNILDDDEEHQEEESETAAENDTSNEQQLQSSGISGQIGTLRLHKSGKLTMMIGGVEINVCQGIPCSFLQDVVLMDSKNQKRAFQLGQSTQKLILTPNIYQR